MVGAPAVTVSTIVKLFALTLKSTLDNTHIAFQMVCTEFTNQTLHP